VLVVVRSSQFKRDVKTAQKRGKDLTKLQALPKILIEQRPLPPSLPGPPPEGKLGRLSRCTYRAGLAADLQNFARWTPSGAHGHTFGPVQRI